MKSKQFKRHFRIYLKNNHPAYIIDEEGNLYIFHRITHSKTSGGRVNIEIENPLIRGDEKATYLVKKIQRDKKGRFSPFELELKPGVNVEELKIKSPNNGALTAGASPVIHGKTKAVKNVSTSKRDKRLNHNGNQAHHRKNGHKSLTHIKSNNERRRKRKHHR